MHIRSPGTRRWLIAGLFLAAVFVFARFGMPPRTEEQTARLLKAKPSKDLPWKIIGEEEIERGTIIPPATHVILRLPLVIGPLPEPAVLEEPAIEEPPTEEQEPEAVPSGDGASSGGALPAPGSEEEGAATSSSAASAEPPSSEASRPSSASSGTPASIPEPVRTSITREALFGNQGKTTRYWGYCFPQRPDGTVARDERRIGFPGDLFLSEAERALRAKSDPKPAPFTALRPPRSRKDLDRVTGNIVIRHQKEVFFGGEECYVVTSRALSIGTDSDGDGMNVKIEEARGTDPALIDTDDDGLTDGDEVFRYRTDPLKRDTDGDGLVDGLETRTGTDPRKKDTDGDGLCDGLCWVGGQRSCADFSHTTDCVVKPLAGSGEDRNLNGSVDGGESDPRTYATSEGISDGHRYYQCLLEGKENC